MSSVTISSTDEPWSMRLRRCGGCVNERKQKQKEKTKAMRLVFPIKLPVLVLYLSTQPNTIHSSHSHDQLEPLLSFDCGFARAIGCGFAAAGFCFFRATILLPPPSVRHSYQPVVMDAEKQVSRADECTHIESLHGRQGGQGGAPRATERRWRLIAAAADR